jgi:hypothetical protein
MLTTPLSRALRATTNPFHRWRRWLPLAVVLFAAVCLAPSPAGDFRYNERLAEAYYGKPLAAVQAIDSTPAHPKAEALRKMLGSIPASH